MLAALAERGCARPTSACCSSPSRPWPAGWPAPCSPRSIARQAEGAGETEILIKATQAEIAQLAGTSRESASRFLATLEREGVVSLGRGKVTVHEPARLRNYIH